MNRQPASNRKSKSKSKKSARKTASKRPRGRPTKFTAAIARKIIDGLCEGTPLTILCKPKNMPSDRTVREWVAKDTAFSSDIAGARETGFDRIALDALAIADEVTDKDTIRFNRGEEEVEMPNKEWLMRSKLRVETRLKLLAKWDPKRYGDRIATEISGPDGKPIKSETSHRISEELQEQILQRTAEAARIAASVTAPASFRGEEADG